MSARGAYHHAMNLMPTTRAGRIRLLLLIALPSLLLATLVWYVVGMPGSSFRGPLPSLTAEQRATSERLRETVDALCMSERNLGYAGDLRAADSDLAQRLDAIGVRVDRQPYRIDSTEVANLEVRIEGSDTAAGVIVVGAHYDSIMGTRGADDNASGAAGLVELVRLLAGHPFRHTILLVFYTNEEPPSFQTDGMGSLVHATSLEQRGVDVVAMLSIESIGFYSRAPGSQVYPQPFAFFYPSTGDFIAFVGDLRSRALVRRCVGTFRRHASFPSEGVSAPASIPGIGWSDHWSYWQRGFPALMVTDTAPFRNPNYHRATDLPDTLDFDAMARVVHGLADVIVQLDR